VETLKIAHTTQFVMMFNVEKAVVAEVRAETGVFDFAKIEAKLQGTVRQQHNIQATSTLSIGGHLSRQFRLKRTCASLSIGSESGRTV
jgi:hypothetical protein